MNKQQQPDSGIHDTSAHCPQCVPNFNLLGLTVPEKSVTKNFNARKLERKKNEEIKGAISSSNLFSVYAIHLPTVHMCTKFQSSRPHSVPGESVTKNSNVENWTERKMKK